MKKLNNNELINICGGLSITGTLLNSLVRGISSFLDLGRYIGNALRRTSENKMCPIQ